MKTTTYLFLFLLSFTGVAVLATPTPISIWSAEGNANDSVGANHGTFIRANYAPGKVGQAFLFNGYDNWVIVDDSATLDRPNITNAFTVSAWIKWDGLPRPVCSTVLRKASHYGVASSPWITLDLAVMNSGNVSLAISAGVAGGQAVPCLSPSPISALEWHFITGTYDGALLKVYVDGVLVQTQPSTLRIGDCAGPLYIGSSAPFVANNEFGGLIDEVELYDQALTIQEIIALRDGYSPPTANAGADQIVYTGVNAQANVTLDGSASTDFGGYPLTFSWSGAFGTATGVSPTITLPVGIHTITVTVADQYNQTSSATTHVAVVQGVGSTEYAQMQVLLNSLTAQAQIDANTITALTQKNTILTGLLQSLLPAFEQIQAAAATISTISEQKKTAVNTVLNGN